MPNGLHLWIVVTLILPSVAYARTLVVGEGQEFELPSAAAAIAEDGDRVAIQPGEYFDCAVWKASALVVEGVGSPEKVVITDKSCQGKALFVTQGDHITIRNLTLTRARVPDGNGAGIRAEGQDLSVEGVRFINNQNGILSSADAGSMIVRESLFERNGTCEAACAHGMYVNQIDLLKVERSRFVGTKQGHHIKSRARRTEVTDCVIEDGAEGTASYAIDAPNGGSLLVRRTSIEKGPQSENHSAAIVIGAEGVTQRTPEITIEDNTFRNDGPWETFFVNNLTATPAILRGNRLAGSVKPLRGDGQVFAGR
jgi:hypothetical protein